MYSRQPHSEFMQPIRRQGDADTFLMAWTGGIKAAQLDQNRWRLLPVLHSGGPHVSGFYTQAELGAFLKERGYRFVAFQQINWRSGSHFSHWAPIIPGERNHAFSPSDLWSNVARRLGETRTRPLLRSGSEKTEEEYQAIMDDAHEDERLANSISLSLRNLDTSVEHIASFYHEELINQIADGNIDGRRSATMRDQYLYEQVHSFFLHLGSVRDYLAAFIANQIGMDSLKVDSMARLIEKIRGPHVVSSPLLQELQSSGNIAPQGEPSTKWMAGGWLDAATDTRNEFVHRRTYGQKTVERMGHLRATDRPSGLFRYFRPIKLATTAENDVFDVIVDHYENNNRLLHACAKLSGHDTSMRELDPNDVISFEVTRSRA
ncbi:hypothetical protein G6M16_010670 [Agrobacterium tumefaciens]|nr:hypothetical protein G6M16_010670 [Agrobacterium tumefaciens]